MADPNAIEIAINARNRASDQLKQFARDAEEVDRVTTRVFLGMAAGALAAETAVVGMSIRVAMAGDRLADMGDRVGMAGSSLSRYEFALKRSGATLDGFIPGLKMLSSLSSDAAAGSDTARATLDRWGVSIFDASGKIKSMNDLILDASEAVHQQVGEANQLAAATDLFGRAALESAGFIKRGRVEIEALLARSDELGNTMSDTLVAAGDDFDRSMTEVKGALQGVANTIAEPVIPALTRYIDKVSDAIAKNKEWRDSHPEGAAFLGGAGQGALIGGGIVGAAGLAARYGGAIAGTAETAAIMALVINPAVWAGAALAALGGIAIGLKSAAEEHAEAAAKRAGDDFDWSKVPGGYLGAIKRATLPEVVTYGNRPGQAIEPPPAVAYAQGTFGYDMSEARAAGEAADRWVRDAAEFFGNPKNNWKMAPPSPVSDAEMGYGPSSSYDVTEPSKSAGVQQAWAETVERNSRDIEAATRRELDGRYMVANAAANLATGMWAAATGARDFGQVARDVMQQLAIQIIQGSIMKAFGFASGGVIPMTVGTPGRDSVPILAMPGERVLSVEENRRFESGMASSSRGGGERGGGGQVVNLNGTVQVVVPASPMLGQMDGLRAGYSIERSLANLNRNVFVLGVNDKDFHV